MDKVEYESCDKKVLSLLAILHDGSSASRFLESTSSTLHSFNYREDFSCDGVGFEIIGSAYENAL
jgi:hypothetical protein